MSAWTALLPLLGVALGALLQYWLSRGAEARKQLELLRSQAHVDFLRAIAQAAHARSADDQRSAVAQATDAKARIAVYSTATVVRALASFEEAGPALDNPHSKDRFLALVSAMRGAQGKIDENDLRAVLIGPRAIAPQRKLAASSDAQ